MSARARAVTATTTVHVLDLDLDLYDCIYVRHGTRDCHKDITVLSYIHSASSMDLCGSLEQMDLHAHLIQQQNITQQQNTTTDYNTTPLNHQSTTPQHSVDRKCTIRELCFDELCEFCGYARGSAGQVFRPVHAPYWSRYATDSASIVQRGLGQRGGQKHDLYILARFETCYNRRS